MEVISLPTEFTGPMTRCTVSKQNEGCMWNVDSPVNKLY